MPCAGEVNPWEVRKAAERLFRRRAEGGTQTPGYENGRPRRVVRCRSGEDAAVPGRRSRAPPKRSPPAPGVRRLFGRAARFAYEAEDRLRRVAGQGLMRSRCPDHSHSIILGQPSALKNNAKIFFRISRYRLGYRQKSSILKLLNFLGWR